MLYSTAGLATEGHGLFGTIAAALSTEETATFTVTVTPANGFASPVTLSRATLTGVTYTLNPTTVTANPCASTSILTATNSAAMQSSLQRSR
jgi:hypothetical protein